jgi:CelD/BcsL family acetyltransferase involved in cellulose biosynthesis
LGDEQNDYNDILICKKNIPQNISISDLWGVAFEKFPKYDFLNLNNIPEINFYLNNNTSFSSLIINESNKSHFTHLPSNIDLLMNTKKRKKIKNDIQRQIKRLNELGDLKFEIIDDPNLCKEYTNILINQKRERFKNTSVPDSLKNEYVRNFYINVFEDDLLKRNCHLSILKLNNEVIACHWGIINNNVFYYLMPTFDNNYSNYSPGKILIYYLMNWAIENRIKFFDFTIGSEDYKKDWSDNQMILYQHVSYKSISGYFTFLFFKLLSKIKNKKKLWNFCRKTYRLFNLNFSFQ